MAFFNLLFAFLTIAAAQPFEKTSPPDAYKKAVVVFSGKIENVSRPPRPPIFNVTDGNHIYRYQNLSESADVSIGKIFKRADAYGLKEGVRLTVYSQTPFETHSNSLSCRSQFKAGEEWLFYAEYNEEIFSWQVSDCFRTQPLRDAKNDLDFFRELPRSLENNQIAGRVLEIVSPQIAAPQTAAERQAYGEDITYLGTYQNDYFVKKADYRPVAGARVEIVLRREDDQDDKNYKTVTARTDGAGFYRAENIPDGFTVWRMMINPADVAPHRGFLQEKFGDNASISYKNKKSYSGVNFYVIPERAVIQGKVIDENGKPVSDASVSAIPVNEDGKNRKEFSGAQSIYNGSFGIEFPLSMSDGEFYIVAKKRASDDQKRFASLTAPTAAELAKAPILKIKAGEIVKDFNLKVSSKLEDRVLAGSVSFSDGTPVTQGRATFSGTMNRILVGNSDLAHYAAFPSNADIKNGAFSLSALQDSEGKLQAELIFRREVLEKCLDRKLDLPAREKFVRVVSKPLMPTADRDSRNSDLKFLIPPCRALDEDEQKEFWLRTNARSGRDIVTGYGKILSRSAAENSPAPDENDKDEAKIDEDETNSPQTILRRIPIVIAGKVVAAVPEQAAIRLKIEKLFKPADVYGIEAGDEILIDISYESYYQPAAAAKLQEPGRRLVYLLAPRADRENLWMSDHMFSQFPELIKGYLASFEKPPAPNSRRLSGYLQFGGLSNDFRAGNPLDVDRIILRQSLAGIPVILIPQNKPRENFQKHPNYDARFKLLKTVTDADGFYHFDDLPAGVYWVYVSPGAVHRASARRIFGKLISDETERVGTLVDLDASLEAGIDFDLNYQGRIEGVITDADGKPVASAKVQLFDVATLRPLPQFSALSSAKGEYRTVEEIPPGKYFVKVENPARLSSRALFQETFFPGAADIKTARPIEITLAQKKEIVNVVLKNKLPERIVSGKIIAPANLDFGNKIYLTFDGVRDFVPYTNNGDAYFWEYAAKPYEKIIESGSDFNLRLPNAAGGYLQSYVRVNAGAVKNCLPNQFLPAPDKDGTIKIYSVPQFIPVGKSVGELKLDFTMPTNCFNK